jgi:hypothetical protein
MAIDTHDDEAAARALFTAAQAKTLPLGKKGQQKRLVDIITLVASILLTPLLVFLSMTQLAKPGLEIDLPVIILVALSAANLLLLAARVMSLVRVHDGPDDVAAFAVRWAASIGDEEFAPLALVQPTLQGDAYIQPFDVSCSWIRDPGVSFNGTLLAAAFVAFGISIVLYLSGFQLLAGTIYIPSVILFFVAGLRRDRESINFLRVDEQGLHGRYAMQSRPHAHIRWERIRSFAVRERPTQDKGIWLKRYSVDADDNLVTWDDKAKLGTYPYSVWGQIAGIHLASVVAARTGLPLRDTTRAWDAINTVRQRTVWDVADNPSISFAIPVLDRAIRLLEERNREPWRQRVARLAWTPLILYVAICLAVVSQSAR